MPRRLLMMIAIISVLLISLLYFPLSFANKAVLNALLVAAFSGLIARDLLLASPQLTPAIRATGILYALNGLVFVLRALFSQTQPALPDSLSHNPVAAVILLWLLCSIIAITLGLVLMTTERLQADLDKQANHDPLTGALNRRACEVLIDKAIAQAQRQSWPLSVLMMDLDKFKRVNDLLGHATGDEVLCRFVDIAQQTLREQDIFYRFGGEEFVAILPNTRQAAALLVAERLRESFASDSSVITAKPHPPFMLTVSIGIAELNAEQSFESVLRQADGALYHAKQSGRNRCSLAP